MPKGTDHIMEGFMNKLRLLNSAALLVLTAASCLPVLGAEDWSRFRGPNGTGVSTETNLPNEFGPEKSVVWKTALPPGHSSPVLSRTRIYVTAHDGDKKTGKLV